MNKKKVPESAIVTQQKRARKAELEVLKEKAEYWRLQFEIRDYTLRAEAIQPAYEQYLIKEKEKNDQLRKAYEEHIQKLKEGGVTMDALIPKEEDMIDLTITQEIIDMNPQMVEEGLKVGDTIKVSNHPTEEEEEGVLTLENETTGEGQIGFDEVVLTREKK